MQINFQSKLGFQIHIRVLFYIIFIKKNQLYCYLPMNTQILGWPEIAYVALPCITKMKVGGYDWGWASQQVFHFPNER